jgi:L,D-peptidoglycan transpeptidase YkuD (ErfK/YbiS/YcfS/YnhG family)
MKNIVVTSAGKLFFNNKKYRCALGRNGVRKNKQEGDGSTPAGCFAIRKVFYRPDKMEKPTTVFPTQALDPQGGWCDDVNAPEYNTYIHLPYSGSHEKLWRDDDLYDIVAVLGYNDNPPIKSKGSAIFLHIADKKYQPTAGCIALSRDDLSAILKTADPAAELCVQII